MTSIEFHLRPSVRPGNNPGSLFVRVIHRRVPRSITLPYRLFPDEWDPVGHRVIYDPSNKNRLKRLRKIEDEIGYIRLFLEDVAECLEISGHEYSSTDIISAYRRRHGGYLLSDFVNKLCAELIRTGRERTARGYQTVVNRMIGFTLDKNIELKQITPLMVRRFEHHLQKEGKAVNTISFYMRNLRSIYNKAVRQGLLSPSPYSPFEDVFTGVKVTRKRALTKEEMSRIDRLVNRMYDFGEEKINEGLRRSCLLFLFSFYARGMSFVDMAYLRKENLRNNVISYRRRKTGQPLEIKVTPSMKRILEQFENWMKGSPYLLPIIHETDIPEHLQYESALRIQNNRLKKIARLCGVEKNLSTHVARHSWATIAKREHLPLAVISEGLGHTSERTTAIYLASFDRSVLDRANEKVSRAVKRVV